MAALLPRKIEPNYLLAIHLTRHVLRYINIGSLLC
jgi:hypothetical protein